MFLIILHYTWFVESSQNHNRKRNRLVCIYNHKNRVRKSSPILFSRLYSTHNSDSSIKDLDIKPWFVTGLIDGEGSFIVSLRKNTSARTNWEVQTIFKIGLHRRDLPLLYALRSYWGNIGSINKSGTGLMVYRVSSMEDLASIIDHFSHYPLITQKRADFELFKHVVDIKQAGRHTTLVGLQEILNIRASMNKGLTEELTAAFPKTIPVVRPPLPLFLFIKKGGGDQIIPDPYWVAGFVSGEGNFSIGITKSPNSKIGYSAQLRFKISQHSRDQLLMRSFVTYWGSGSYFQYTDKSLGDYRCVNFVDIYGKIIPFFKKYPILGIKALDFNDWSLGAEILESRAHLTYEGLARLKSLKEGMNKGRKWSI